MLKKTTVYLSDEELILLKKKATIQNKTVSEVIRLSIRQSCKPTSKEERQVWNSLDKIWAKTSSMDPDAFEVEVDKAVKQVCGSKKTRRRA
jgi:hypothetical protein